ncbi:MAG: T9SS type A sorting domain-containing protein [Bacteroidetes bacterium]|nr:T9SS C-terminal target domain-containing protein [Bacteroidota bacterium]MBV6460929.1 hypothetical protein [Flavobacteriales bacterium]WKZ75674.1 MAG: M4 family metallopeptidase [Vicingaceae bacterium]MCL4815239.1 M4 family metallopeptidase [Flavobacteriales bacterium]NOG94581.1 T9SS type A sorting domain-containing protein [Bacteroidota bacterium]
MKKIIILLVALAFTSVSFSSITENIYKGADANRIVPTAKIVRMKSYSPVPNYVEYGMPIAFNQSTLEKWLQSFFGEEGSNYTIEKRNEETDQIGFTHINFNQLYKGVRVTNATYKAHIKEGKLVSVNGDFFPVNPASETPVISEQTALQHALSHIGAQLYKWQVAEEEEHLKEHENNSAATYFPKAELHIVHPENKFFEPITKLAYKFNIYAHQPMSRQDIYVDATNGNILLSIDRIHHGNSNGTVVTAYSGTHPMTTDSVSPTQFRLRETTRGNGVRTFNLLTGTNYGNAVDFTDTDNYWNNVNPQKDQYAGDAHWGAQMTYDYYFQNYNRNSIDNNGFQLNSYVHYSTNYVNAFWDGQKMTYGDGDNSYTPLTSLDICGHEVTHGLTTFTADLVYSYESGALNESFSDIFGTAVEWFGKNPGQANWLIGEDIGSAFRSMLNPKVYSDPHTYLGQYWYVGPNDNGGVHTNSGVQNHWFYRLSVGGSGTNDNGDSYNISGIGMAKAGAIAFRNLTVYLSQNSQYADARFYAIKAAEDLYGACSFEVEQCTNAWYAVGVGGVYQAIVIPNFAANSTTSCTVPFTVSFNNTSTNASTFNWSFGDGGGSTQISPSYTYNQAGTYNVKLVADGGNCGIDSITKNTYIVINTPPVPTSVGDSVCTNQTATLTASGSGNLTWYDAQIGGNMVGTGTTFTTPALTATTYYYVDNATPGPTGNVGPIDNTIGGGNNHSNGSSQFLIFDVLKPCTIVSAWALAQGTSVRTFTLWDNQGNVIQTYPVNIPDGPGTVTLNIPLTSGTGYRLGGTGGMNLYRNSSGTNYPYTLNGVVSITGSSAGASYYYYLYNWEVKEADCVSERTPTEAFVEPCAGISENGVGKILVYPNPANEVLTIEFDLTHSSDVEMKMTDITGKEVLNISSGNFAKGKNRVQTDISGLAEGMYIYNLRVDGVNSAYRIAISR